MYERVTKLKYKEKIAMRAITSVTREKSGLSTALVVEANGKKYFFSGFFKNHMEEAFHIISYLSNNPISYIDLSCAVPDPTPPPAAPVGL